MSGAAAVSDDVLAAAARLAPGALRAVAAAGRGGNSRIYRVTTADDHVFALKSYPPRDQDPRDRLGTEFAAMTLVHRHDDGRGATPTPVARDPDAFGLYEWIDGAAPGDPGADDIDAMLDFIGRLGAMRDRPEAAPLALASEACLTIAETATQLRRRRDRLAAAAGGKGTELADFIADGFTPALETALARAESLYRRAGLDPAADLVPERRILSPSDFGFHNALRRPDGRLVFIDFEYFGWDDPVRLAGDVSWHPGMNLDIAAARRFTLGMDALLTGADPSFPVRLNAQWPLLGLRWCAIILNEFLPERWAARVRAGQTADRGLVLDRQMAKARAYLERVNQSMRSSPNDAPPFDRQGSCEAVDIKDRKR